MSIGINEHGEYVLMDEIEIDEEPIPMEYTEIQKAQQDITDLMLADIENGQYVTDLELMMLGGM